MRKKVTFIYPFDPLGSKVGGIETFIRGCIKYSPSDIDIEHIGVSSDRMARPLKVWHSIHLGKKSFSFYPVIFEKDENKKRFIPLSIRFAMKLKRRSLELNERTLIFNRLEPAIHFLKSGQKKIGLVHNDIEQQLSSDSDSAWKYAPSLYFFIEKKILRSLDHIYTVNSRTLNIYVSKYPDICHKISFLPTWVDPEIFCITDEPKEMIRQKIGQASRIPIEHTWILFVGRLQKQKAPFRLLETFKNYSKLNSKSSLLIIGEGNLQDEMLRRSFDMGVYQNIHFLGFKTQQEIARFYQAADVLILTSYYEGMPRSCLEALGSGLPVVSTDVGEVHRVVKTGFSGEIVEDFSPDAITRQIDKVVRSTVQYTKENCLASVTDYTPQIVLSQVYERIRNL